jgi:hypothetical protein
MTCVRENETGDEPLEAVGPVVHDTVHRRIRHV